MEETTQRLMYMESGTGYTETSKKDLKGRKIEKYENRTYKRSLAKKWDAKEGSRHKFYGNLDK